MNEICIKHNPFLLKTDILVDGKEPRDDSDLYYLIYKEQRINKWIKYLPECLTSSFNQTGFDFVFCGIEEDAQFVKEHLEKSQDIQVESFCSNLSNASVSQVKSKLIKTIEQVIDSDVEGIDRDALKNILEVFSGKKFSNVEDEIALIIQTKEDVRRLFDCEALTKEYEAKLSQLYKKQSEIVIKIEVNNKKLEQVKNSVNAILPITLNILDGITVDPMKDLKKYYKDVKENSVNYLSMIFSKHNADKEVLIKKVEEKLDKVVKPQIDSGIYLIKSIQAMLKQDTSSIEAQFKKDMSLFGVDLNDFDLNIECPEINFSVVVGKGQAETKYSYANAISQNINFDEIDIEELVYEAYDNSKRAYSESEMFRLVRVKVNDSNEHNKEEMTKYINEYHGLVKNKIMSEANRIVELRSEQIENEIELYMEEKRELFEQRHNLKLTKYFVDSTNKLLEDLFEF